MLKIPERVSDIDHYRDSLGSLHLATTSPKERTEDEEEEEPKPEPILAKRTQRESSEQCSLPLYNQEKAPGKVVHIIGKRTQNTKGKKRMKLGGNEAH